MTHPFHWVPADGQRHASNDPLPECTFAYPHGTLITTLCGLEIPATTGTLAWLWFTCAECDDKAHDIVGRPRRSRSQQRGETSNSGGAGGTTRRENEHRPAPPRQS